VVAGSRWWMGISTSSTFVLRADIGVVVVEKMKTVDDVETDVKS
jgi:hypothetical protein